MTFNRNEYLKARYRERMDRLISMLGGICARCGTAQDLQLDHVDPGTKDFEIGERWGTNWDLLVAEARKCQLLCRPCHEDKTRIENTPPTEHETDAAYRHGCRCPLCRRYKRDRARVNRAKRKQRPVSPRPYKTQEG